VTSDAVPAPADPPSVVVARTDHGWRVLAPGCAQDVDDLLEGMSLANLVAEEIGCPAEPDRAARRAARGGGDGAAGAADPRDARIAALERTVAQLEHALAARVVTERAIGVLAERHATAPRTAFEVLRSQARSLGRPVHELAREVMATLDRLGDPTPPAIEATPVLTPAPRRASGRSVERGAVRPGGPAMPGDGRH
jgi:hypothetical protein